MEVTESIAEMARELQLLVRTYDGLTKLIVSTKQRLVSMHPDEYQDDADYRKSHILFGEQKKDGSQKTQGLEQIKQRLSRDMLRAISDFPVWMHYLDNVPGIGPAIGAKLLLLWYFRFVPVCAECGGDLIKAQGEDATGFYCSVCSKKAKGDGVLKHRVEKRDFPTISSWWHFMGRHIDQVSGKMPKYRRGTNGEERDTWNAAGRKLGYDIKESFNKGNPKYRAYAEKRKSYRLNTHPDSTKGHRHNMAWNETVKLFLSHFWQVARTIDGLPITEPWVIKHGNHDAESIIPPFYWNGD